MASILETITLKITQIVEGAKSFAKFNLNLKAAGKFAKAGIGKMRGFSKAVQKVRGSLIGLLFFGQLVSGMISGLFQPVLQVTGVFELISEVLILLFLPIITALIPYLLRFTDWLINLDETTLKWIGGILLAVAGLALIMVAVITGVLVFAAFVAAIGAISVAWVGIVFWAPIVIAGIVAIIAVVIKAVKAFKPFFDGSAAEQFAFFKEKIMGFADRFSKEIEIFTRIGKGFWKILSGFFQDDTEKMEEGASEAWGGIKDAFKLMTDRIKEAFTKLFDVLLIKSGVFTTDVREDIIKKIKVLIDKFKKFGKDMLTKLGDGIVAAMPAFKLLMESTVFGWWASKIGSAGKLFDDFFSKKAPEEKKSTSRSPRRKSPSKSPVFKPGARIDLGKVLKRTLPKTVFKPFKRFDFGKFKKRITPSKKLFGPRRRFNDFLMRPGQPAISFSPQDTLIGFKGNSPNLGGKGSVVINQTLNIMVNGTDEIRKAINENNTRLVEDIRNTWNT